MVCAGCFLVGYLTGREHHENLSLKESGTGSILTGEHSAKDSHTNPTIPNLASSGSLAALANEDLSTAAGVEKAVILALEDSDPISRMAKITLLMESATPATIRGVVAGFLHSTTEAGRDHGTEWSLLTRRVGSLLGPEMLGDFRDANDKRHIIEGWAFAHPQAALAYTTAQSPIDSEWVSYALYGMCLKDPRQAFSKMLNETGPKGTDKAPYWLMKCAIQNTGLEQAKNLLQEALNQAPVETGSSPEFLKMFDALADSLFLKHWAANTQEVMAQWLEKQRGEPYLTDDHINRAAHDLLYTQTPQEAIAWIERMNQGQQQVQGLGRLEEAFRDDPMLLSKMDEDTLVRTLNLYARGIGLREAGNFGGIKLVRNQLQQLNPTKAETWSKENYHLPE